MDTRWLRDALTLLEEGNLSAAAARRNLTQPAFSRRIRALEDWIGRPVIARRANRIEISDALARNEQRLRGLLSAIDALPDALSADAADAESVVLTVASPHSLSASAFPEIAKTLRALRPAPRIRLRTRNTDENIAAFLRHEADLLLRYEPRALPRTPFDGSVTRLVWRRDGLAPFAGGPLRYAVDADGGLPPDTPIVRYPEDSEFGRLVADQERYAERRLEGPAAVESAYSLGVVNLALDGAGAAWAPLSLIYGAVQRGDAVLLSDAYGRAPLDIVVYGHAMNANAAEMITHLGRGSAAPPSAPAAP